ncbi:hypothetical protein E5288_WYG003170 [Bos mutus]|uniref:Uncharacterized protein n=1 Tax=Bos mutus TaxID=72004 RepID=A0A6B0R7Z1_9CETA|nr:hypothetical protein [Bos mutus]
MRGLAMAIFSIVFALETRFCVEIQHSDVCHNTRALFDLRYILMVDMVNKRLTCQTQLKIDSASAAHQPSLADVGG